MLETIRAYAGERFAAAADADAVREDHYRYYLALAQRHGTERALWGADAREHLARLDAEIDNLHAALGWAIAQPSAERALALAAALGAYWLMRNRYADAVDWVDQALGLPGADAHPALRVRAAVHQGQRACGRWGAEPSNPRSWPQAEAIARALGDPVLLSQALQSRVLSARSRPSGSMSRTALADEALHWATPPATTGRSPKRRRAKAMAASSIADLRERVDQAASLLGDVGNVHQLASLLAARGLRRAVSRQRSRRDGLRRPRDADRARNSTIGTCG